MSHDISGLRASSEHGGAAEKASAQHRFPVHIGTVTHQYLEENVEARRILTDFGFTPSDQYVLERISHEQVVAEYGPGDLVSLERPEDNRFRAVPVGGGRA